MHGVDRFIQFFCLFIGLQLILGLAVWEFGRNKKGSKVIAYFHGEMTIAQKYRHVKLPTPECMKIIYVQVEVENDFTTPEVKYNWTSTTVVINYMKLQKSISYYDIVARAVREKDCSESRPRRFNLKKQFMRNTRPVYID